MLKTLQKKSIATVAEKIRDTRNRLKKDDELDRTAGQADRQADRQNCHNILCE